MLVRYVESKAQIIVYNECNVGHFYRLILLEQQGKHVPELTNRE